MSAMRRGGRGRSGIVKLVVDANTIVGGLLFEGNEARLLELGRLGVCELFTNENVRGEVRDVLARPHIGLSEEETRAALVLVDRWVTVLSDPPPNLISAVRGRVPDQGDLPVLAGFEHSGCDHLVTGDRRLRERIPRTITTRAALTLVLADIG